MSNYSRHCVNDLNRKIDLTYNNMTAIVAVLNKHGAAIAADSAVTLGDTHKVINNGNKIFTLSKYEPVSIATYGNSSLLGIPWEIIIKTYRKHLSDRKFPVLFDYVNDFIEYLRIRQFVKDQEIEMDILNNMLFFYRIVLNKLNPNNEKILSKEEIISEFQSILDKNKIDSNICAELTDYTLESFRQDYKDAIITFFSSINEKFSEKQKNKIIESYFYYLRLFLNDPQNSGLVFVGYGDEEIYPSMINIEISRFIQRRIKFTNKESIQIGVNANASITPFAQVDVCHTIIKGMTPIFLNPLKDIFQAIITKIVSTIAQTLNNNGVTDNITSQIRSLDFNEIAQQFVTSFEGEKQKMYTAPLLNTIVALNKEDLANLAESLVSLTSVVRRISPTEETVGGPVDVAIISKGDGFIWKNRKHYFDPKMNTHFFDNYYRN